MINQEILESQRAFSKLKGNSESIQNNEISLTNDTINSIY